jgi:hypothetical protein
MEVLAQVLKETKFGFALAPKTCTNWESRNFGHVNAPMGSPKHEERKIRGAPKRLGHVDMRSTLRFGWVSPNGHDD